MKKTIILFSVLLLSPNLSLAIGISPSTTSIEYYPGLEFSGIFHVVNSGSEPVNVSLYASGELSQYVSISSQKYAFSPSKRKMFRYNISLPKEVLPGKKTIRVGAVETPPSTAGIFAVAGSEMLLQFFVPYPPRYVEVTLDYSEEKLTINFYSRGNESAVMSGNLILKDYYNKTVRDYNIEKRFLDPEKSDSIEIPVSELPKGSYSAEANVFFEDGNSSAKGAFNVGYPTAEITGLSYGWTKRGERAKINVTASNLFNGKTLKVYAATLILDRLEESNKVSLEPLENRTFLMDIDTSELRPGTYKVNITLNYENKKSEPKQINLLILPENIEIIVGGAVAIVIIIIAVIVYIFRRKQL